MNILRNEHSYSDGGGLFSLQIRRPGLINGNIEDHSFGPLSRMDHAKIARGTVIRMHEHINEEILTYMWSGEMLHKDSTGLQEFTSPTNLMMMGAGKSFFHEESTPNGPVEVLQIFIHPEKKDLEPEVQFAEMTIPELSEWRLIGGPTEVKAPLVIRQKVIVYDLHGKQGERFTLPQIEGYIPWLYVFDGEIMVHGETLLKGDGVSGRMDELTDFTLSKDTTIVLFLVNKDFVSFFST